MAVKVPRRRRMPGNRAFIDPATSTCRAVTVYCVRVLYTAYFMAKPRGFRGLKPQLMCLEPVVGFAQNQWENAGVAALIPPGELMYCNTGYYYGSWNDDLRSVKVDRWSTLNINLLATSPVFNLPWSEVWLHGLSWTVVRHWSLSSAVLSSSAVPKPVHEFVIHT